ncbi:hypothetical protein AURDEDRAFT_176499 [Auricularia subglabra TFB-10046 SS5]|nr:hypothetical protein AURDEDRAFT_176499 [Auricularia subglabra TFB-10046 SS5]
MSSAPPLARRAKTLPFARDDIELGRVSSGSSGDAIQRTPQYQPMELESALPEPRPAVTFWQRFRGDLRETPMPTLWQSTLSLRRHGIINVLLVFVPIAWASQFSRNSDGQHIFSAGWRLGLNLAAIIPLQKRFEWLGEEMIPYLGAELGELLNITLSNTVEASLAIGLLVRDNYRLLQMTVVGVVILHILLVPGVAFLMGGAKIVEQELHSGKTQINHTLLTLGVMAVAVPTAFFAALDRGNLRDLTEFTTHLNAGEESEEHAAATIHSGKLGPLLTDSRRGDFLKLSRGIALMLLLCYLGARTYMHNPPGKGNALRMYHENVPSRLRERALRQERRESAVSPWFGVYAILQCVALMAVTAQFLVGAMEELLEHTSVSEEWFGLVLLPLVSFAGDAFLSLLHYARRLRNRHLAPEPDGVASGLSIDLSIQFLLFWMPLFVIIAWCAQKPLLLLFDLLEVAVLVAACFLVNYVTADAKTNWAEGAVMIVFYVIIVLAAWFYPGQIEVRIFNVAHQTVAEAVANGPPLEG